MTSAAGNIGVGEALLGAVARPGGDTSRRETPDKGAGVGFEAILDEQGQEAPGAGSEPRQPVRQAPSVQVRAPELHDRFAKSKDGTVGEPKPAESQPAEDELARETRSAGPDLLAQSIAAAAAAVRPGPAPHAGSPVPGRDVLPGGLATSIARAAEQAGKSSPALRDAAASTSRADLSWPVGPSGEPVQLAARNGEPVPVTARIALAETHFAPVGTPGSSASQPAAGKTSSRIASPSSSNSLLEKVAAASGERSKPASEAPGVGERSPSGSRRAAAERSPAVDPTGSGGVSAAARHDADASMVIGTSAMAAMPPPPAVQIGSQIAGAVPPVDSWTGASALARGGESRSLQEGPLKVVEILLQPRELGTVTVRMSMKDGALTLAMQFERHEAMQMLSADADLLKSILEASGFRTDSVVLQLSSSEQRSPAPVPTASAGDASQISRNGDEGSSRGREPGAQREGSDRAHGEAERRGQGTQDDDTTRSAGRSGPRFV